jgi:hypothetical protein
MVLPPILSFPLCGTLLTAGLKGAATLASHPVLFTHKPNDPSMGSQHVFGIQTLPSAQSSVVPQGGYVEHVTAPLKHSPFPSASCAHTQFGSLPQVCTTPHSESHGSRVQAPFVQRKSTGQTVPQPPQLKTSSRRSVHVSSQMSKLGPEQKEDGSEGVGAVLVVDELVEGVDVVSERSPEELADKVVEGVNVVSDKLPEELLVVNDSVSDVVRRLDDEIVPLLEELEAGSADVEDTLDELFNPLEVKMEEELLGIPGTVREGNVKLELREELGDSEGLLKVVGPPEGIKELGKMGSSEEEVEELEPREAELNKLDGSDMVLEEVEETGLQLDKVSS